MKRLTRSTVVAALAVLCTVLLSSTASATVRISRAELNGTQLRIEGTAAPNRTITVNGTAMGTSDSGGNFRVQRDPFTAPADCRVRVDDGSGTPATATLSGCTVTSAPSTAPSTTPSLASVGVNPTDVIGGDSATGTVTLSALAPAGGFTVSLSSDNTAAATVPPSVVVPAGARSATFIVSAGQVNAQSATIIGTVGGDFATAKYAIITVRDAFHYSHGSIAIVPGGNGSGTVTSQPAGINCTITNGNGSGACTSFFLTGTVVRLDARPAANSSFQGWRGLPGCSDPSKITVARGTTINCQPGFSLK
jgi:hypothetical protein